MLNMDSIKGLFGSVVGLSWNMSRNKFVLYLALLLPILAILFGACNGGGGGGTSHP